LAGRPGPVLEAAAAPGQEINRPYW